MSKIIVALDFAQRTHALQLLDQLDPALCKVKIGLQLYTRYGPSFVKDCIARQWDVFLDLKWHDIPNTVANACLAAADLGVWMVNVHALGGKAMLMAAREAVDSLGSTKPLLTAVTLLTSHDQESITTVGINAPITNQVLRLATLAHQCGIDGVVCSGHEASALRETFPRPFCLVTPGIRLSRATEDDQVRTMTPVRAIKAGADYLVMGRPITQADNPRWVLEKIYQDIDLAF